MCLECMRIDLFCVGSVLKLCLFCAEEGAGDGVGEFLMQDSSFSRRCHTRAFANQSRHVRSRTGVLKRAATASHR